MAEDYRDYKKPATGKKAKSPSGGKKQKESTTTATFWRKKK